LNLAVWINQYADENEVELLLLEPREQFDAAIVGVCHRFNDTFVLYDRAKVIEILAAEMVGEGDEEDDPETMAWEHFGFNIIGGWVGSATPAFLEVPCGTVLHLQEDGARGEAPPAHDGKEDLHRL